MEEVLVQHLIPRVVVVVEEADAAAVDVEGVVASALFDLPFLGVGIGYRNQLHRFAHKHKDLVNFLEITAEHFFDESSERLLSEIKDTFPLVVHGLDLSLATPGKLSPEKLNAFKRVAKKADAKWVSEHIAFTTGPLAHSAELGHLLPAIPTPQNAEIIISHVNEIEKAVTVPIILENITSHLPLKGTLSEVDFINLILERTGCGLLLDVTNLYINSVNHSFNAFDFLRDLRLERVIEVHIVGFSSSEYGLEDLHRDAIQEELLEILHFINSNSSLKAILLERDENLEDHEEIERDLQSLHKILKSPSSLPLAI